MLDYIQHVCTELYLNREICEELSSLQVREELMDKHDKREWRRRIRESKTRRKRIGGGKK
jgi:hypothetical protein